MAVKINTKSVLFRVILPVCLLIAFSSSLPSAVFGEASWEPIAPSAGAGNLFIVSARRGSLAPALIGHRGRIVIRDGRTALVIIDQAGADELSARGLEIKAVLPHPAVRARPGPGEVKRGWESGIQAIIDTVTEEAVWNAIGDLSGVNAVSVGGSPYTIQTRNTYRTAAIEKATQYCLEYFQSLGLAASYQTYSENGVSGRNVFAVQTGSVHSGNIYVICAHLDDMPNAAVAPGADDNASGSAAVLLAAAVLSSRHFENTIRYVLFTGEEQGLYGSYAYAAAADAAGDNILGALNLDMIAYDSNDDGRSEIYWGSQAASKTLADLLIDTNTTYGLDLAPQLYSGSEEDWSDHASFWDFNYPAITGIESDGDFNPEYHYASDTRANCNGPYAAAFAKAAVGTAARLAVLVAVPSPTPYLPPSAVDSGDYDGDGTDECAVFRPSSRTWLTPGSPGTVFGSAGDLPVPADYSGDGDADFACFRSSSGLWAVRNVTQMVYGASGDIPAPGDYDGDGTSAPGLFRPTGGAWYLRSLTRCYFGLSSDTPVPGDWDGDGAKDIAVFRPASAFWAVRGWTRFYFGLSGDRPVPGDFDGTGWKAGIFRPSSGLWAVRGLTRYYFGASGDWPAPADYDGDGEDEAGVFRAGTGVWHIRDLTQVSLGQSGDLPVTR
jgi:Zn-dependent M28 family amino/carboxypeptidase